MTKRRKRWPVQHARERTLTKEIWNMTFTPARAGLCCTAMDAFTSGQLATKPSSREWSVDGPFFRVSPADLT